jgi:cysteine desulfurase/selenocysteine lyase
MASVQSHTDDLSTYAREQLSHLKEVSILGDPSPASGIISFTVAGIHPHDLASLLSEQGICIRAGHHCAAPLHAALGITASNRISFGIYNTRADIDVFITELQTIVSLFNHA